MNIDLLASSISYKELFELHPKILNVYDLFSKIKNKIHFNHDPFKILFRIHKYQEKDDGFLFFKKGDFIENVISKNMSLKEINELEINFRYDENKKTSIYNTSYEMFMVSEVIFLCGFNIYLNNLWCVYYDIEEDRLINVIYPKNKEFLKLLFVESNDYIYSEKYVIKKEIFEKLKYKINDNQVEEYFCI